MRQLSFSAYGGDTVHSRERYERPNSRGKRLSHRQSRRLLRQALRLLYRPHMRRQQADRLPYISTVAQFPRNSGVWRRMAYRRVLFRLPLFLGILLLPFWSPPAAHASTCIPAIGFGSQQTASADDPPAAPLGVTVVLKTIAGQCEPPTGTTQAFWYGISEWYPDNTNGNTVGNAWYGPDNSEPGTNGHSLSTFGNPPYPPHSGVFRGELVACDQSFGGNPSTWTGDEWDHCNGYTSDEFVMTNASTPIGGGASGDTAEKTQHDVENIRADVLFGGTVLIALASAIFVSRLFLGAS